MPKKQTKKEEVKINILKEDPNPIDVDQTTVINFENKEIMTESIVPAICLFIFGIVMVIISIICYLIAEGTIPNIFKSIIN